MGQAVNQIIEISVTYAQFPEPLFPRVVSPILAQLAAEGTSGV
jgi:hypothetical protein